MRSDEPDRYEGENYVLDQQVVRAARKFSPVDKSPSLPKIQDFGKPAELIRALESRAMLLVHAAGDDYARISRAVTEGYIATEVAVMIKAHAVLKDVYLLVRAFKSTIVVMCL